MKDKVIGTIYVTDDYDKFKKLQGNRDVKGVQKVIASIKAVGYVLSPILVNEKFEVVDGQTRLDALRELHLPVPYMEQDGIGLNECRHLNIGQSNWNTRQFIESYAKDGNESYARLLELIEDFGKIFSLEGILFIALPSFLTALGGANFKQVREGNVTMSDEQYESARRKITSMIALGFVEFKERYNMASRSFWSAVSYAYIHDEVDPAELIRKMNEDPNAIVPCARLVDQLRYFDDAYNRRKQARNKVFMAADFQRGEYL